MTLNLHFSTYQILKILYNYSQYIPVITNDYNLKYFLYKSTIMGNKQLPKSISFLFYMVFRRFLVSTNTNTKSSTKGQYWMSTMLKYWVSTNTSTKSSTIHTLLTSPCHPHLTIFRTSTFCFHVGLHDNCLWGHKRYDCEGTWGVHIFLCYPCWWHKLLFVDC